MRIISGKKRGTNMMAPEGGQVRPTADRVREGLFNILSSRKYSDTLSSPVIADIFAGTGMLGLEAWSRGAAQVVFVENNSAALAGDGARTAVSCVLRGRPGKRCLVRRGCTLRL